MCSTRRSRKEPLLYIPELTRFEIQNRRYYREEAKTMANKENQAANIRVLLDTSVPSLGGTQQSIIRMNIEANNF